MFNSSSSCEEAALACPLVAIASNRPNQETEKQLKKFISEGAPR